MTTFFRLLKDTDKATALRTAIARHRTGDPDTERTFMLEPDKFRKVPNTPFAYWVDDSIRDLFVKLPPFESEGRTVKVGLQTSDDFRFVRAWWEVDADRRLDPLEGGAPDWREDLEGFQEWCRKRTHQGKYWVPFAKGGEYSPYYSDIHLVVNWKNEGEAIKEYVVGRYPYLKGNPDYVVKHTDFYFRPGITWPRRSNKGMTVRALNAGCIFADKGPVGFGPDPAWLLAVMNSRIFLDLVGLQMAFGSYEAGVIGRTPVPQDATAQASSLAMKLCNEMRSKALEDETNREFGSRIRVTPAKRTKGDRLFELKILHRLLRDSFLSVVTDSESNGRLASDLDDTTATHTDPKLWDASAKDTNLCAVSQAIGIAFGRFDVRTVSDPELQLLQEDPFSPLPAVPPTGLLSPSGLPATDIDSIVDEKWLRARSGPGSPALASAGVVASEAGPTHYPISVSWDGVLAEGAGDPRDVVERLREVVGLGRLGHDSWPEEGRIERLSADALRDYISSPAGFFDDHLKQYSRSRRKAPIYWPLSTASGGYTIWVYYPRLDETTLFTSYQLAREKYDLLEKELVELQAIPHGDRRRQQQKRFDELVRDVAEVNEFAEEILRITKLPYKPDHDDGVPICAAPLYKLFRHNAWAKYLQGIWEELESGKYDWAHLAYAIWPERVRQKAREDKSIAIAHRLERDT